MEAPERPEAPSAQPVAGDDPAEVVGRRIGAALLDIVLLAVLFVVVGIALGGAETDDGQASIFLEGGDAGIYFLLVLLYYFVTEAAWGRTVGKHVLGLRVARTDGSDAGAGRVAVRTVLRIVDTLPFLYLLGLIVVLVTPRKQRIGDLAAGTVVTAARR